MFIGGFFVYSLSKSIMMLIYTQNV